MTYPGFDRNHEKARLLISVESHSSSVLFAVVRGTEEEEDELDNEVLNGVSGGTKVVFAFTPDHSSLCCSSVEVREVSKAKWVNESLRTTD